MKTASVRDLRYDFPKVEAWLKAGEEVRITKRNKVIGTLSPEIAEPAAVPKFDVVAHEKWLNDVWGDRVVSAAEWEEIRQWETGEP
ncbi:type II toxin-antitoxin system Phd/YefM family antitoxin [Luteolibacter sp. Populi]|uniref:type II toxin-antitoxin system Phd/YefM family antitoxin n=1 Tax=Luteolibacter sp. Populi TaxID=3230487 RepID=UPI0034666115